MVAAERRLCARASAGDAGACRGAAAASDLALAAYAPTTPASDFANPLRFRLIPAVSLLPLQVLSSAACACQGAGAVPRSPDGEGRRQSLDRPILFVEK